MNPTASNKLFNILQWPHEMPGIIALNTLRGCAHDDDPYSEVNLCDYTADQLCHVEACRNALCIFQVILIRPIFPFNSTAVPLFS